MLSAIDISTLEICKDKFIDDDLKSKITDMLYRVKLNGGQEAYLSALVEHQSTASREMPLRVLRYESLIMQRSFLNYGVVPLVYTLVYYNGKIRWHYSQDIKDLIDAPAELVANYALKPFQLIDLSQMDDQQLREHLWSGVMGLVMKHIYSRDLLPIFRESLTLLQEIESLEGQQFIKVVLYYMYKNGEISDEEQFNSLIRNNLSQDMRREFMTLAEKHFQERFKAKEQEVKTLAEKHFQERFKAKEQEVKTLAEKQGRILDAKKMLAMELDLSLIAEITEIDIATLSKMKNSIKKN